MTDTKNQLFKIHGAQIRLGDRKIGWTTWTSDGKKIYVSPRNRLGITKRGVGNFFIKYQGFGLAVCVFEFLKRNGFDEVHLKIGKSETLISKLEDWKEKGILVQYQNFEPQYILPERFMTKKTLSLSELMESPKTRL